MNQTEAVTEPLTLSLATSLVIYLTLHLAKFHMVPTIRPVFALALITSIIYTCIHYLVRRNFETPGGNNNAD